MNARCRSIKIGVVDNSLSIPPEYYGRKAKIQNNWRFRKSSRRSMWFNSITRAKPYLTLYLRTREAGSSAPERVRYRSGLRKEDKNSSSDTAWSPSVHVLRYQIHFGNGRNPFSVLFYKIHGIQLKKFRGSRDDDRS